MGERPGAAMVAIDTYRQLLAAVHSRWFGWQRIVSRGRTPDAVWGDTIASSGRRPRFGSAGPRFVARGSRMRTTVETPLR